MERVLRKYFLLIFLIFATTAFHCSKRTVDPEDPFSEIRIVKKYGSSISFDIVTWNIEQFPMNGTKTISTLAQLIKDIDVDLIAVQEINNENAFINLLDSLDGFNGYVSALPNDILKLGIIYKTDIVSISSPVQIFTSDGYAFPRPPVVTFVEVKENGMNVFDFHLIILHLKAFGDQDSENRRRDACEKLKDYIDTQLISGLEKDVIVLGDMNDEIDDPPANNVFQVFLDDATEYQFLTMPLIGQASYPGFNSLIDHILISSDALPEYSGGSTQILNLDFEFSEYSTLISDHRPVLAKFYVF